MEANPILSSIVLQDVDNDTIQNINGHAVSNLTASDLVTNFPYAFYFDDTSLGVNTLCVCRIDGQPLTISATNATSGTYTPELLRIRLFGPRRPRPQDTK